MLVLVLVLVLVCRSGGHGTRYLAKTFTKPHTFYNQIVDKVGK